MFTTRRPALTIAALAIALVTIGLRAAAASDDDPRSNQPPAAPTATGAPHWYDTVSFFVGPDGSKQPQDLGINANMGVRVAANAGVALSRRWHLGAQFGVGENYSADAVNVLDQIGSVGSRRQTFVTAGVFARPTPRFTWTLAYDFMDERYYDRFRLSQWRADVAYGVTRANDVGVWMTHGLDGADGVVADTNVHLSPIAEVNVYTRHTWATGAKTTIWIGEASGHHDVVLVFPDNPYSPHVLVWGAALFVPLSDRFALTGAANLLTPASTGTVDAFLGLSIFPGRSAYRSERNAYAPPIDVANNPTFPVDLKRQ